MSNSKNVLDILLEQLVVGWENEIVEFKEAKNDYDTDKLGQYFSALANEANLHNADRGWLVFGVENKKRKPIGTNYRPSDERLNGLKLQIREGTEPSVTFRNIHDFKESSGARIVIFEIPAAPRGMPISWKGHYYARAGESLVPLGISKLEEIRGQTLLTDWTAQTVEGATLDSLDPEALRIARSRFTAKHANRIPPEKIEEWSDTAFLDRAKVTQEGRITRTALLLLGKQEATWKLSPHPAEITWKLEGEERAYEHFGPPFLLSSTRVFARIRNIQMRMLPENELLAHEVAKYDQKVVLEALHNCIAHQDYARSARIVVIERPECLILENEGAFFEGRPEEYIFNEKVPRRYRNPFLAQAMTELNMIDHMGYGIQDIYKRQRQRFLPLPDYDLHEQDVVRLTIHGRIVDPAYSRLLMQRTGLPLADVLALDRVQKRLPISEDAARHLRIEGLIEGRKPHIHVSARIAAATSTKAEYIRTRAQDDDHYAKLITDYLTKFGVANRKELDNLLMDKLSDALTGEQKVKKIANLLTKLRRQGRIVNTGPRAAPQWKVAERKIDQTASMQKGHS